MVKKLIFGSSLMLITMASIGWFFRAEILLYLAAQRASAVTVAEHREVTWASAKPRSIDNARSQPNVILIVADDLGINDISTFGGGVASGRVQTPGIDRIAAEGVNFNTAYAGSATCAPSRAMMLTGRYPSRTGFEFTPTPDGMGRILKTISGTMDSGLPPLIYNRALADSQPSYENQGLPGSEVTLAEILRDQGYYTAHIGKWHLGRSAESNPNAQGFDDSLLMASGLFLPEKHPDVVNAKVSFDPIDKFLWAGMSYAASFNGSEWFEPGGYLTDYWTDEALKVIRSSSDQPFFLYMAHWATHTPLQATRSDYEAVGDIQPHRLRVYAAMVRALDRSVGRILETLDQEGIADNTIVIFTSDNGGAGYIGLSDINSPYRGWKLTLYEGGVRVPMLVRWPNGLDAGTVTDTPVAHIDILPTVVAAAGATLPETRVIDGVNILAPLTNPLQPAAERPLLWTSAYYQAVRKGNWKLQRSERPSGAWLYDLATDPTEQRNIIDQYPMIASELTALLDEYRANSRPPLYHHVLEGPVAVDKNLNDYFEDGDDYVYWPN